MKEYKSQEYGCIDYICKKSIEAPACIYDKCICIKCYWIQWYITKLITFKMSLDMFQLIEPGTLCSYLHQQIAQMDNSSEGPYDNKV